MPVERVTKELLERELNSQRLFLGIEAAIKKSAATDREAGFSLCKELFTNNIMYPNYILLGNKYECSSKASKNYAETEYERVTGRMVKKKVDLEFWKFCDEKQLRRIPYPEVPEKFRHRDDFPIKISYDFFGIHTHVLQKGVNWTELLTPSVKNENSEGDFFNLEERKYPIFDDCPKVLLRPINGIVLSCGINNIYPFLFYQKKDFRELDDSELRQSGKEANTYLKFQTASLLERFTRKIPRGSFHNFGFGIVDLNERELRFSPDFNLESLSYSSESVLEEEWAKLGGEK